MKIFVVAVALFVWMGSAPQVASFEKQALALAQQMPASGLDAGLPKDPLEKWFKQLVGPRAGVVWQLTECGEPIGGPGGAEEDLPACVEAHALFPNGRKVVVAITVGTFKKGITGEPSLFRALVGSDDLFYQVPQLRDLPKMLRAPESMIVNPPPTLPATPEYQPSVKLPLFAASLSQPSPILYRAPDGLSESEAPPSPPPRQPPRVSEGVSGGDAITKVTLSYPAHAKLMKAYGPVEVEVTISEDGQVIGAKAISGHIALRNAAVEAARKWVFKPKTINGEPVRVQSILTFVFTPGGQ